MTIFKEDRDLASSIAAACRMDTEYDPSEDIANYRRDLTRATLASDESLKRIEVLEERLGDAYQMFGQIAADSDIFDTPAAIALLDLLSKD